MSRRYIPNKFKDCKVFIHSRIQFCAQQLNDHLLASLRTEENKKEKQKKTKKEKQKRKQKRKTKKKTKKEKQKENKRKEIKKLFYFITL